jgi:glycosyltransferase involved in cell wall biosynthesis
MSSHKHRVLIVSSHPVQYGVPLYRIMAEHPQLDVQIAYCSLQGVEAGFDKDFGTTVAWDIPLLDGYTWLQVKNNSPQPKLGSFFGLVNLGLWKLITQKNLDAVIVYTGYSYASFWISMLAAKLSKKKFVFSTDASDINPRNKQKLKTWLKRLVLPHVFKLGDSIMVGSTPGKKVVNSLGIPEQQIILTPFATDNKWWTSQSAQVNVAEVRKQWDISENANVLLFCAKLQSWKRPADVLKAFAKAHVLNSYLIFAGDGSLKLELEAEARDLGIADNVRFLGFVNQSQLPSIYSAADLFILPSEYEPFGVVVNEAMLCCCPVIVSDRVGSGYDLVKHGETGFVYPCGDIDTLAKIVKEAFSDRDRLKSMGVAAAKSLESWSPQENVAAIVRALDDLIPVN